MKIRRSTIAAHSTRAAICAAICLLNLLSPGLLAAQSAANDPSVSIGDKVILTTGRVIDGIILQETDSEVQIQTRSGKLTLRKDKIKEVVKSASNLGEEITGDNLYAGHEYRKAIESYRIALQKQANESDVNRLKGKIQLCHTELERGFRQQFDRELKRIDEHMANREYVQALAVARQIQTDPQSSDVAREIIEIEIAKILCAKAVELSDQIRDKEALQELDQAIVESPNYYRSYLLKAQILNKQGERTSETAQLFIDALTRGAEDIKDDDREELNLTIARILRDTGQAGRALEYYLKVIELLGADAGPEKDELVTETVKTFEALAENFSQQSPESIQLTIEGLQKAVELQPSRFETRRLLSRIYMDLKRYDDAIAELRKVIELRSGARGNHILLGQAFYEKGDYPEAEDALQTELRIDPENYESRLNLSKIYIKQKKYNKAIQFGKETLKIAPDYFAANEIIAEAYFLNEEYNEAKTWFTKIITQQPDNLEAQLRLAQIDLQQENLTKADQQFDIILENLAKRHNTTTLLMGEKLTDDEKRVYAECKTSQGQIQLDSAGGDSPRSALVKHKEALILLPDFAKAYNNMGKTYMAMEQYDKAEEALIEARKLEPDNSDFWYSLAGLYDQLKRPQEAIQHYKEYIIRGGKDWQSAAAKLQTLGMPIAEIPRSPLMKAGEEVEVVAIPTPAPAPATSGADLSTTATEPGSALSSDTQTLNTSAATTETMQGAAASTDTMQADSATTDTMQPMTANADTASSKPMHTAPVDDPTSAAMLSNPANAAAPAIPPQ